MATIYGDCALCCSPSVNGLLPSCKKEPIPEILCDSGCEEEVCVHFDQFDLGIAEPNIIFPGFALSTNLNPVNYPLMIFDSEVPTAGFEDLGSPNETCCTPGPGIGAGGEMGQPGENCENLKKVLIISNSPPNPLAPEPKPDGGIITIDFYEDVQMCEVHLLNVENVGPTFSCGFIKLYDFNNNLLTCEPILALGVNSFQVVKISSQPVRKMTIELVNGAAIAKFIYKLCPADRLCTMRICEYFDDFADGAIVLPIQGGTITSDSPILHPPMIFNSTVPTAGDFELGSPNEDCVPPGAGVGAGGAPSEPGKNCVDLKQILIISDDANPLAPKSYPNGGELIFDFTDPVLFKEMHFLNAATDGDTITLYDAGGVPVELIDIPNVGVNGFTKIQSSFPYPIKQIVVAISGKTAISKVCYCICKGGGGGGGGGVIEVVQLPDNAMTPVEITLTAKQGTYMLLVEAVVTNGAKASFMASSAYDAQAGSIARLTNAPSLTDESVYIKWLPNEKIKLFHDVTKTGGVGVLLNYNVKILTL